MGALMILALGWSFGSTFTDHVNKLLINSVSCVNAAVSNL